jgi:predicted outer membrane repeat protein
MNSGIMKFVVAILLLFSILFSATYYVDADTSDGANWYNETNFSFDLATALSSATSGDTIFVAKSTYTAATSFALVAGVKMYGGFTGGETSISERVPKVNETILHASGSNPVITGTGATITTSTVIDGFVIENGSVGAGNGGGINLITTASPLFNGCIIRNNSATLGAGVYLDGAASPTFSYCLFEANTATSNGGAIYAEDRSSSVVSVDYSTFVDNVSPSASALSAPNKNIANADSCVFWNNANSSSTLNPFAVAGSGAINVTNSGSDDFTNATTTNVTTYVVTPFHETVYYCLLGTDTSNYGWNNYLPIINISVFLEGGLW